jgi:hypothetical protein
MNRMKWYRVYFFILKFLVVIQFLFLLFKKGSSDTVLFLASDIIFKGSVGLFLILYFFVHSLPDLHPADRLIICFGGSLLVFDAFYNDLPALLGKFGVHSKILQSTGNNEGT